MFIYLTGLLFFPPQEQEKLVWQDQIAKVNSVFSGLSSPPPFPLHSVHMLASHHHLYSLALASSLAQLLSLPGGPIGQIGAPQGEVMTLLRDQALSASFCVRSLFHLNCLLPPLPPQSVFEGALPIVVQDQILKGAHMKGVGIY